MKDLKAFLQRWFITALGVLAAANMVSGIHASGWQALLAASLLLGILNAIIRPVMMILSLPLLLVTLGLFMLVINAGLVYFVGSVVRGFVVPDFWTAFKGSLVISVVSFAANLLLGKNKANISIKATTGRQNPPPSTPPPNIGGGPVIDV